MIGLHTDMDAATYHADPCPAPSLNHGCARLMLRSPLHAWKAHPRLGNLTKRTGSGITNIGSAAHALTLGRGAALARIDCDNYRTKEAQNARDAAYAQGFVPLLTKEYEVAAAMAAIARPVIIEEMGADFLPEAVAIARDEHGSYARIMSDAMTPDLRVVLDFKTADSAEPEAFAQRIRNDYTTQAAFYCFVLDQLDPEGIGRRRFFFCAQERDCPEAITFHELDPAQMEIAAKQMERARAKWAVCLKTNRWPPYDRGPHVVSPRPWEIEAEMNRQYEDDKAASLADLAGMGL